MIISWQEAADRLISENPGVLTIDTETTGFDWHIDDYPFLYSFGTEIGGGFCVKAPVDNKERDLLRSILALPCNKVFHNAGFDIGMIRRDVGNEVPIPMAGKIEDTWLMAHVTDENRPSFRLKDLADFLFPEAGYSDSEKELKRYMTKHKLESYADVPDEIMVPYATADAVMTLDVYNALMVEIDEEGVQDIYDLECRLLPAVITLEWRGFSFDTDFIDQVQRELTDELIDAIAELEAAGVPADIHTNPGLLGTFFVDQLGIQLPLTEKKRQYKLDDNVLGLINHPAAQALRKVRKAQKILSTYTQGFVARIGHDGRLHPRLRQVGARTGRFSCTAPNLQNIPRSADTAGGAVRKAFKPSPGNVLLLADYSQIEARLYAAYAQDRPMLQVINDGGDLHMLTAMNTFALPQDEITKKIRQVAKRVNFLTLYGGGAVALADVLRNDPDASITEEDAVEILERLGVPDWGKWENMSQETTTYLRQLNVKVVMKYKRTGDTFHWGDDPVLDMAQVVLSRFRRGTPSMNAINNNIAKRVRQRGYIHTLMGRKRRLKMNEAYKGLNSLIQGSAGDLMKWAMVNVYEYMQREGFKGGMVLTVHDEIIFDVPIDEARKLAVVLPELMTGYEPITRKVPIDIDMSWSDESWGAKRPIDDLLALDVH